MTAIGEGRTQLTTAQNGPGRHTIGQALGKTDDIRQNSVMLEGKEFASPPHPCLNLVHDEQDSLFLAIGCQVFDEVSLGWKDP